MASVFLTSPMQVIIRVLCRRGWGAHNPCRTRNSSGHRIGELSPGLAGLSRGRIPADGAAPDQCHRGAAGRGNPHSRGASRPASKPLRPLPGTAGDSGKLPISTFSTGRCKASPRKRKWKSPRARWKLASTPGTESNIADVATEQVILFVPMKVVCSADCRGLCPVCGANRNLTPCDCAPRPKDSPFASLQEE